MPSITPAKNVTSKLIPAKAQPLKPPFIVSKIIYRALRRYKKGFLNFYGYFHFSTYVKYFIKTRKVDYNRMFAEYYIDYLKHIKQAI